MFSQTTDGVRRRWFIYSQYGGCTYDSGWFVVLDKDHSGTCNWDNESDLPVFMYSGTDTEDVLRSESTYPLLLVVVVLLSFFVVLSLTVLLDQLS